ncbi:MAG TPA: hypothetical protein VMU04_13870 [Candidatus Acidoferrum sp.]|nr:hypothetical protein [Candidatus Acidoferrum sp.]
MKQMNVLERDGAFDCSTRSTAIEDYALNLAILYHDARTQAWAREVYDRAIRLAGREWVRATWWKISDLTEPGVLAGAVSTAMRAEMIVVAVDASEGLPLPFQVWVDNWLPHRRSSTGCLFAFMGRSELASRRADRVGAYLREVARRARLEFLLEERHLPAPAAASSPLRHKTLLGAAASFGAQGLMTARYAR